MDTADSAFGNPWRRGCVWRWSMSTEKDVDDAKKKKKKI